MPRLEEGDLPASASRFKKRRAWIIPDDPTPVFESPAHNPVFADSIQKIDLTKTRLEHEHTKSKTKVKQECNKTVTKVEHDSNKSVTRVEQEITHTQAKINPTQIKAEQEYNKSVTRVEHDYNKIKTRLEQDNNKTLTSNKFDNFYLFIDNQRASIIDYEDDPRSMILSLSDVQKQIFWNIATECIKRQNTRTGPIEIKSFFGQLAISTPVVRTTLNRLVDKRIIQREKGKLGKNGFAVISLPKIMFDAAANIFTDFQNMGPQEN